MNKLQHSESATKRALGMSRYQLFVFVEGVSDLSFYSAICDKVCDKVKFHIYPANEHPFLKEEMEESDIENTSGKKGIVFLFERFREKKLLTIDFQGEKKVVIFFLDKDVDDLLETQIFSEHVVYTKYYTLENHVFVEGDIITGVAITASMTTQQVREIIESSHDWRRKIAKKWLDYVKLCFFVRKFEKSVKERPEEWEKWTCRYSKPPAEFEKNCYQTYVSSEDYSTISQSIEHLYDCGEHDVVFNGKWYAHLLRKELPKTGNHSELLNCIQATLDFNAAWAEHFKQPLRKLLAKINL